MFGLLGTLIKHLHLWNVSNQRVVDMVTSKPNPIISEDTRLAQLAYCFLHALSESQKMRMKDKNNKTVPSRKALKPSPSRRQREWGHL